MRQTVYAVVLLLHAHCFICKHKSDKPCKINLQMMRLLLFHWILQSEKGIITAVANRELAQSG
jgi:hypothetical protein